MKESYAVEPQAVEIYHVGSSTDVILRQNIAQVTKADGDTEYTAYECDEVQFRYPGTLTQAEVEADFDTWWEYDPANAQELTAQDDTDAMLVDHEYRLTMLELGVTE